MSDKIPGERFLRALLYVNQAIPNDEARARYQHMAIISNMLIGADGERWLCGILGEEGDIALPPLVVSRSSVVDLIDDLKYAKKKAKRNKKSFDVMVDDDAVYVAYGAEQPIIHRLAVMNLGELPMTWTPPVPADAPPLAQATTDFRRQHMSEAMGDGEFGSWRLKGHGGNAPMRVDVTEDGDLVHVAFLLPIGHPRAQLPIDGSLFEHGKEVTRSQSILDLEWSADGRPRAGAQMLQVGEHEVDATGLENIGELLVSGPCEHRAEGPCLLCTESKVAEARKKDLVEQANENDEGKPKRKPRKKKADPEAEA